MISCLSEDCLGKEQPLALSYFRYQEKPLCFYPAQPNPPAHLELVFLAVDDDGCDLLIEEDQNSCQHGGNEGSDGNPPGGDCERVHQPAAVVACRLQFNDRLLNASAS